MCAQLTEVVGYGQAPGLLPIFVCMHENKNLNGKSSLYVRSKSQMKSVLKFWGGFFSVIWNMGVVNLRITQLKNNGTPIAGYQE